MCVSSADAPYENRLLQASPLIPLLFRPYGHLRWLWFLRYFRTPADMALCKPLLHRAPAFHILVCFAVAVCQHVETQDFAGDGFLHVGCTRYTIGVCGRCMIFAAIAAVRDIIAMVVIIIFFLM